MEFCVHTPIYAAIVRLYKGKIVDESFSRFLSNGEINSLAYVLKPRLEFSNQKMSVAL